MDKINASETMCVVITHSAEVNICGGDRGTETGNELFQPFLYHTMILSGSILPVFIFLVHS